MSPPAGTGVPGLAWHAGCVCVWGGGVSVCVGAWGWGLFIGVSKYLKLLDRLQHLKKATFSRRHIVSHRKHVVSVGGFHVRGESGSDFKPLKTPYVNISVFISRTQRNQLLSKDHMDVGHVKIHHLSSCIFTAKVHLLRRCSILITSPQPVPGWLISPWSNDVSQKCSGPERWLLLRRWCRTCLIRVHLFIITQFLTQPHTHLFLVLETGLVRLCIMSLRGRVSTSPTRMLTQPANALLDISSTLVW